MTRGDRVRWRCGAGWRTGTITATPEDYARLLREREPGTRARVRYTDAAGEAWETHRDLAELEPAPEAWEQGTLF